MNFYYSGGVKYKNKKKQLDGITFDSTIEANRYRELKLLERAGKIKDLQRQVSYTLIPAQRDASGKLIERSCRYVADFVYRIDGETIVEDVKGVRTPEYKIKRKLMLQLYGIRIKET